MSYDTYLHRSFDYQLSPVPSTVIDWADTRRMQRAVMPSSSTGGAAAAAPLVEVKTQAPWRVKMTALERAARLERSRWEQQRQQQQAGVGSSWAGDASGSSSGSGLIGAPPVNRLGGGVAHQRTPQQQQTHYPNHHPTSASPTPGNNSMYYYVDEGSSRGGGGATTAAPVPDNGHGGANGTAATGSGGQKEGSARLRPAALVMYPTDGSVYAASSPEGEMLGLFSAATPSTAPLVPPGALPTTGPGGGVVAMGDEAAAAVTGGDLAGGGQTAAAVSQTPGVTAPVDSSSPAMALSKRVVDGAVAPLWQCLKDVVGTLGSGVDLADHDDPLARGAMVSLSDYVWSSYGSLPMWRRGSFTVSAGVYAAFGFTQTRQRQLRDARRAEPTTAAPDGGGGGGHRPDHVRGEGMATALLREAREDRSLQLIKRRAPAATPTTPGEGSNPNSNGTIANNNNGNSNNAAAAANGGGRSRGARGRTDDDTYLATVDVGTVDSTSALRLINVLQLEWFWARWRWQGVLNVRLLPPAEHTRVPLCEYVMRTPWTEWAVQSDELVFNWSAFLTLYQQHAPRILLERERSFHATYGPSADGAGEEEGSAAARGGALRTTEETAKALVDKKREEKLRQQQQQQQQQQRETLQGSAKEKKGASASSADRSHADGRLSGASEGKAADAPTPRRTREVVDLPATRTKQATTSSVSGQKLDDLTATAPAQGAGKSKIPPSPTTATPPRQPPPPPPATTTATTSASTPETATASAEASQASQQQQQTLMRQQRTPHWWALRHLKVGAGVSVKNDLASGINLYWGCSGQMGRGLSFSGHVDVLRRLCCALSSSLGPLDLSIRLRMNLITYHNTSLDAGVCCRPFQRYPNTILRASTSATGRCLGIHVDDLTHEFFSPWIASHAEQRIARRLSECQRAVDANILANREGKSSGETSSAGSRAPHADAHTARASDSNAKPLHAALAEAAQSDPAARSSSTNSSEGGWISFGLVTSAWGYLRGGGGGGGGGHSGGAADEAERQRLAAQLQQEAEAAAAAEAAARPFTARVMHCATVAPRQLAAVPRQWAARLSDKGQLPPALVKHVSDAAGAVRRVSAEAWQDVRRLDWLEAVLDGARVDVSVGITHDPARPGQGLRSFVVVSAH